MTKEDILLFKPIKTNKPIPYFYSYTSSDEKVIFAFGANHSRDPQHLQFALIKAKWEEFLDITKGGNRVVFIETIPRHVANSFTESIKEHGESGAICWLANEKDVLVKYAEPSPSEQRIFYVKNLIQRWLLILLLLEIFPVGLELKIPI